MKNSALKIFKDYLILTFGCLVFCCTWSFIFVPNGLVSGGLTGLCSVIQYGTGFPMGISYAILNALLLLLAFLVLGKSFGIRTIYALAIITVFFEILPNTHLLLGLQDPIAIRLEQPLLNPILAALVESIGVSFVLTRGGSTGGTDIIAMVLNKYFPISPGRVYMCLDAFIIASIMLVPGHTIDDMIYGYISVLVFSFNLDYILLGKKSTVELMVFSDKYEEIANYINKELHRGVTALNAVGWYSQQDRKVLLILMRRSEMSQLTDMIKEVDPKAFVTVTSVKNVYGEGFDTIKTNPNFLGRKNSRVEKNMPKNSSQQ